MHNWTGTMSLFLLLAVELGNQKGNELCQTENVLIYEKEKKYFVGLQDFSMKQEFFDSDAKDDSFVIT